MTHVTLVIISLLFILPIFMVIAISLSTEQSILDYGYSIWPKAWSAAAYKLAFQNPGQILQAYKVTAIFSFAGTILALLIESMGAYPLSKNSYRYKKFFLIFSLITMLFSGGMIPNYILRTKYLHMGNTIWVYILPFLANAWNVMILKTFFQGLPDGLTEAAKIDGASEFRILFQIIIPLSTPVLATLGFRTLIERWNDWNTALIYIRDDNLYSLQYMLQRILRETEFIKKSLAEGQMSMMSSEDIPTETLRYAMAVIAAGPMMLIFPFFQKYLAKGLVVGSVKG